MTYDEYLAHHGILGMRWGKKNGPPYPLNASQMTAKEKAKNEVSEFARSEAVKRAKFKEKAKMTRLKEREQVRQNKAQEREERRQNRVDERESRRQNRVDEKELSKQNDFESKEKWEQYKRGRTYVRNFLIGAGVMTVAGLAAYKLVKGGQSPSASGSSSASNPIKDATKYIKDAQSRGIIGDQVKDTMPIKPSAYTTSETAKRAENFVSKNLRNVLTNPKKWSSENKTASSLPLADPNKPPAGVDPKAWKDVYNYAQGRIKSAEQRDEFRKLIESFKGR